ncbi:MAG: methionine--tRNA ligase subunit beta, partial [Duncaniella sp.]|nr:methionine--tRNA ligase subunit beta [Duncaniella sp.]
ARLTEALDTFHFREGLKQAMEIARLGNRYLQETEPWKVAKTDMARTAAILNTALQICANIAVAFEPFVPFSSAKLAEMLGLKDMKWDMLGRFDLVSAGQEIAQPELLFEKIEDATVQAQVQKLQDTKKANEIASWRPEPQAEDVDFDTFCRSDLRVGTILECEKVPKADKLLRFLLDDGMEKRTIVSGIAKYYPDPSALVGKQICFIANLPPRKLKGIVSEGMILSAVNSDGALVLIEPSAPVAPGSKIG